MPQLGETVTEGTITRWMKQVGDPVAEDEVLFEVSADKVDSEVPSPVAGVLTEILVPEGDTVDVGTRVAAISDGDGAPPSADPGEAVGDGTDQSDGTGEDDGAKAQPDQAASDGAVEAEGGEQEN